MTPFKAGMKASMASVISLFLLVPSLYFGGGGGCGSSATSESGSGGGGTDAGEASVSSLTTVPSVDISSLDFSQSSGSDEAGLTLSALSALTHKAMTVTSKTKKSLGEDLHAVGGSSRAGCESNMHKQEMIRMSQQAQLDRCYAEAMEKGELITIPEGSFAIYSISPPEHSEEEMSQFCDDIPEERTEEKRPAKRAMKAQAVGV